MLLVNRYHSSGTFVVCDRMDKRQFTRLSHRKHTDQPSWSSTADMPTCNSRVRKKTHPFDTARIALLALLYCTSAAPPSPLSAGHCRRQHCCTLQRFARLEYGFNQCQHTWYIHAELNSVPMTVHGVPAAAPNSATPHHQICSPRWLGWRLIAHNPVFSTRLSRWVPDATK